MGRASALLDGRLRPEGRSQGRPSSCCARPERTWRSKLRGARLPVSWCCCTIPRRNPRRVPGTWALEIPNLLRRATPVTLSAVHAAHMTYGCGLQRCARSLLLRAIGAHTAVGVVQRKSASDGSSWSSALTGGRRRRSARRDRNAAAPPLGEPSALERGGDRLLVVGR